MKQQMQKIPEIQEKAEAYTKKEQQKAEKLLEQIEESEE
jgi:hypothetical protein